MPITAKVTRQPNSCPISRPSGKPSTIANALPIANKPIACVCLPFGATRKVSAAVIDQNTA